MEKKTICYKYILPNERFNNPHFPKLLLHKTIFFRSFQVIQRRKCHLGFSHIEKMFGRKLNKKKAEQYLERKLNFTLLFAKYYLYNAKLTHGGISMPDFIAKINHKYSFEGLNVWQ